MTDLNAPLDPTERDALAWRMLVERLEMADVDLDRLARVKRTLSRPMSLMTPSEADAGDVVSAVHDALAYRRQT